MNLFWCHGYEATSIQDLVEGMGINRSSLYGTFGDKHALYLAALERYQAIVGAQFLTILEQPGSAKAAIRRVFESVVEESLADGLHRGCLMTNSAVERAPHDADIAARIAANVDGTEAAFYRALSRAQAAGEIDSGDPRARARFLVNALHGLRVMAKATADRAVLEDVAAVTLSVLD